MPKDTEREGRFSRMLPLPFNAEGIRMPLQMPRGDDEGPNYKD